MKAVLVLREGLDLVRRVSIDRDSLMIGRNDDNNLVLDSPRVSRYHARIVWTGTEYQLEDLGSRNGTFRNGTRLDQPASLSDGDTIQVGDISLSFEVQGVETLSLPCRILPDGLTRREVEILASLAIGHTNQEVAEALVLSVRTVERHVSNIYIKTRSKNRAEATSYAIRHGIVGRQSTL